MFKPVYFMYTTRNTHLSEAPLMSQVGSSFTGEAKLGNPLAEISHIKMSGVERFPRLHKFWHVDGVFHDSLHAEDFVW